MDLDDYVRFADCLGGPGTDPVPQRVMVDNLRSAVLRHVMGQSPVLNPRYKDFADHFGVTIRPCGVGQAHEKGRVESAVGYIKKNFLAGLELTDFALIIPAARLWLDGGPPCLSFNRGWKILHG